MDKKYLEWLRDAYHSTSSQRRIETTQIKLQNELPAAYHSTSSQRRIETFPIYFGVTPGRRLTIQHPAKEGLKPKVFNLPIIILYDLTIQHPAKEGLKHVKTPSRLTRGALLTIQHPAKEGLKLPTALLAAGIALAYHSTSSQRRIETKKDIRTQQKIYRLTIQHPAKEGLKLLLPCSFSFCSQSYHSTSSQRRIETQEFLPHT